MILKNVYHVLKKYNKILKFYNLKFEIIKQVISKKNSFNFRFYFENSFK